MSTTEPNTDGNEDQDQDRTHVWYPTRRQDLDEDDEVFPSAGDGQ